MNQLFLSKSTTSYLDGKKIPLNVNALGDPHALGIIDNFARRINKISRVFLENKNTIWINSIPTAIK